MINFRRNLSPSAIRSIFLVCSGGVLIFLILVVFSDGSNNSKERVKLRENLITEKMGKLKEGNEGDTVTVKLREKITVTTEKTGVQKGGNEGDTFRVKLRPNIYLEKNYSGDDPNCFSTIQRFIQEDKDIVLTIPKHSELQQLSKEETECLYHRYVSIIQQHCALPTRIGPLAVGGWNLCLDDNYKLDKNSLVYSFSYHADYSNYAKMLANDYNSQIYSYDSNIRERQSQNGIRLQQMMQGSDRRSFKTVLTENGHDKKNIDVVTLDIGEDLLKYLKELITSATITQIKQLSFIIGDIIEMSTKEDYVNVLDIFRELFDAGFRIMWMGRNMDAVFPHHPKRTRYYSLTMVNKNFKTSNAEPSPYLIPAPEQITDPGVMYFKYVTTRQILCKEVVRMGRIPDGGWEVCNDAKYRPAKRCLVYSFGIDNDFSFDDDISTQYSCTVMAFDPSLNLPKHQHTYRVNFFPVGLSDGKKKMRGYRGGYWQLNNLQNILHEMGHDKSRIDVLKLDIEFAEWNALPSIVESGILSNVVQLSLELHSENLSLSDNRYRDRLKILKALYDSGFRIFCSYTNHHCKFIAGNGREHSGCYEINMVNINIR